MARRAFGPTGLEVAPIGLGGMPLSLDRRPSEAEGIAVIHAALDAGMDLIDTADVYCLDDTDIGHNERLISKALAAWSGKRPLVATKGGLERPNGSWTVNGRPEHLRRACEASLRGLGVDCIDVYQLHAPDPSVRFADTIGALADLKAAGKVRWVGLSNVSVAEIDEARGIVEIVSVQNRCNVHDVRAFRDGVLARCEALGLAFLPYSPVGGSRGKEDLADDPILRRIAEKQGATPYQVALAWLLSRSPAMIPIPGASRIESALSSAAAMDLVLTDTQRSVMDRAYLP